MPTNKELQDDTCFRQYLARAFYTEARVLVETAGKRPGAKYSRRGLAADLVAAASKQRRAAQESRRARKMLELE